MGRSETSTTAYRAALYFGVERDPRASIPITRPKGVVIVHKRGDRTMLLFYREWPQVSGEHVLLTDRQRDRLIEALRDA